MSAFNCPNCGVLIEGVSPHIRSIDCSHCGSWLRITNQLWGVEESGQRESLDAPAFLRLNATGKAPGSLQYVVRGRLRFQYASGSWDEWWIEDSAGEGFWLEEDDGGYERHQQEVELPFSMSPADINVGDQLSLPNGISIYVTEKYQADIVGREGFLPVDFSLNTTVTYVDGVTDDSEYSLEIETQRAWLTKSEPFDINAIEWSYEFT